MIIFSKIFFSYEKQNNYPQYFLPEIKSVKKNIKDLNDFQIPENFEELRQNGENESELCEIIRKDNLNEFIRFVEVLLDFQIETSIYETNLYLDLYDSKHHFFSYNTKTELINYVAFFGSIQIYKYLVVNKVKEDPTHTLHYAIYSNNIELVHMIEDKIEEKYREGNYSLGYAEDAMKIYNNDMVEYFRERYKVQPKESLKYKICNFDLI